MEQLTRCGNCQHWKQKPYYSGLYGVCAAIENDLGGVNRRPDGAQAVLIADHDDAAELQTRAEFGCTLGIPKTLIILDDDGDDTAEFPAIKFPEPDKAA